MRWNRARSPRSWWSSSTHEVIARTPVPDDSLGHDVVGGICEPLDAGSTTRHRHRVRRQERRPLELFPYKSPCRWSPPAPCTALRVGDGASAARASWAADAGEPGTQVRRRCMRGREIADQSSGRAAKSRLDLRYHDIPAMGCFHLPFMSFKASLCVSSPFETTSFRCLSCAFMTSSAVAPWCGRSHGPPSCLHVIVFMGLAFFQRAWPSTRTSWNDDQHPRRSGLGDADQVARGVAERAVAHSPGLGRRFLEHLGP
jgi:hypothetical protein